MSAIRSKSNNISLDKQNRISNKNLSKYNEHFMFYLGAILHTFIISRQNAFVIQEFEITKYIFYL